MMRDNRPSQAHYIIVFTKKWSTVPIRFIHAWRLGLLLIKAPYNNHVMWYLICFIVGMLIII